jgi:hypothetical protein
MGLEAFAQGTGAKSPARDPYLSADKYGTTHFDPRQTDSMPYPAPRGVCRVDLRKAPRVTGGLMGYMQLASTAPRYILENGRYSWAEVSPQLHAEMRRNE